MNYVLLIVAGLVIGFIVAAPIGPVNLICIRRTLSFGSLNGFLSGLGGAMVDGVYAAIVGFGLTAIGQWIEGYSHETLRLNRNLLPEAVRSDVESSLNWFLRRGRA